MNKRSSIAGFTLVELLAAITIFSLMAIASWRILDQLVASTDRQLQSGERLLEIQLAVQIIDQDLNNHIDLDIFDANGDQQADISTREFPYQLSISKFAWFDPENGPLSAAQRVSYELREQEESEESFDLIRKSWNYPNRTAQTPFVEQKILSNLALMDMQFITEDNQILAEWPPLSTDPELGDTDLMAVQISLELLDYPSITRLYVLEPAWSRDEIGI